MGRFSQVLLTADFDRTLTAPDSSIPERNLLAIREFIAQGGAFTVNTGRSVPMFRRFMEIIPANAPFLLYNGSAAYDMQREELTDCHPIALDLWETMDGIARHYPELNLELQGVDAHYSYGSNPKWDHFYDCVGCAHAVADRSRDLGPFLKLSLFGEIREYTVANLFEGLPEEIRRIDAVEQALRQHIGDKVEIFRAAPRIIDIHAKGVSKIRSARNLQKKLNRQILVCVGDAHNDIPMLEGADYAFCPADGVVADRFENVCPCGDGAVADVILKKIPEIVSKLP